MPTVSKFGPMAAGNRRANRLAAFGDLTRVIGMARAADLSRKLSANDESPERL